MITNPYEELPMEPGNDQAVAWGRGFLFGLTGPLRGGEEIPPDQISEELTGVFEEGRLAGQECSVDGLDIFPGCVDTREEHHIPLSVELGFEAAGYIKEAWDAKKLFMGGSAFASGIMVLLDVALSAHHFVPPDEAIDRINTDFLGTIQSMGRENCEFYVGGGVDFDTAGCELMLSPLFRESEQARLAATEMGRANWFVGYWAANQCGTLQLIEGTTD